MKKFLLNLRCFGRLLLTSIFFMLLWVYIFSIFNSDIESTTFIEKMLFAVIMGIFITGTMVYVRWLSNAFHKNYSRASFSFVVTLLTGIAISSGITFTNFDLMQILVHQGIERDHIVVLVDLVLVVIFAFTLWSMHTARKNSITVVDNRVFYPGERYYYFPSRHTKKMEIDSEGILRMPKAFADMAGKDTMMLKVDIESMKQQNIRHLDMERFIKSVVSWIKTHPEVIGKTVTVSFRSHNNYHLN